MDFWLVPKSATLDDLERRNSLYFRINLPNSVGLRANYVKVVDRSVIQKNPVFKILWLMAMFAEITEN